ncbi:polysaccharide lyase family protein [Paenibacillus hexagrammi]|uniref:rhamnogalacturonan endolyase n=1 Tax=Paenibacillus hexagrammi TaxID=2908839 RepID=A0ABY3SCM3_9BACL|nr:polysaccharide lyase family protein [Paenibacillus sp. YPD9-1]UJF31547.1 cohesin domain-containing protein [Paenibacillus sp. YPD9-1]
MKRKQSSISIMIMVAVMFTLILGSFNPKSAFAAEQQFPLKFDFGTSSSVVADGYIGVGPSLIYTAEKGYGLNQAIDSRDRSTNSNSLLRDFVISSQSYTFQVDLPNDVYNVKVIAGDDIASNRTAVTAEGIDLGSTSTPKGQFAELNASVPVTEGKMVFTITGNDGRLNGIEISRSGDGDNTPPQDVTLVDNGSTVTLKNSKISFDVNKTTANISSIFFTDSKNPYFNLVGGQNGRGYYLANYSVDGTSYQKGISGADFKVVSQTPERAEISMTVNDPSTLQFYLEVHMVLEKDSPGFYYYTVYKYPDTMPDGLSIGQLRYAFALGDPSFTYFAVDDQRGIQQRPTIDDLSNDTTLQDTTYLLPGADLPEGRIYSKYQNISNMEGDNHVFMASNGKVGVSIIQASKEYVDGGPTKQDLTVHDYYNGEILLWHEHTGHYGTPAIEPAKGWEKVYGPFYLYVNEGSGSDASVANVQEMWEDAKAKASEEQAKWPYTWITDPTYAASSRSDVSGKLEISDGSSANEAHVILSRPGIDWQLDTESYTYSARAGADGKFTIPAVRPGTYTLTAFVDGVMGEYKQENITVGSATPLDLGTIRWTPAKYGDLVWQIGTPDRSAEEFHVYGGEEGFRKHLTWLEYPYEFPNGVDFKIGESDPKTDWNYFQPMFKTPGTPTQLDLRGTTEDQSLTEWKIRFDSDGYQEGTATLNIALASSVFGSLDVKLNGTPVGSFETLPGPPGDNALYRLAVRSVYRQLDPIQFDANLIHEGENIITLSPHQTPTAPTSDDWMNPMASIMYDAIRLEVADDAAPAGPISAVLNASDQVTGGAEFEVAYGLESVTDSVYAQDLTFTYDPSAVEFDSAESVKEGLQIISKKEASGQVRLLLASLGSENAVQSAGDLVKLKFKAKSDAASASTVITLTQAVISNGNGDETELAAAAKSIAIIPVNPSIPGDMNGEGHVTVGDLAIVASGYGKTSSDADWATYKAADLSGDGKIGIEDLAQIARLILGME